MVRQAVKVRADCTQERPLPNQYIFSNYNRHITKKSNPGFICYAYLLFSLMFLVSVLQKYDFLTGSDIVTRSEMYGGEYLKDAFHKDFLWVEQLCGFI